MSKYIVLKKDVMICSWIFCKYITDKQFLLKCMLTMYLLHSRYTFDCAKILSKDVRSNLFFRARGCKMLASSKEEKHLNSAEKYLINIGNDISYAENCRYRELSHFLRPDFYDVILDISRKPLLVALWAFMRSENNTNYYPLYSGGTIFRHETRRRTENLDDRIFTASW